MKRKQSIKRRNKTIKRKKRETKKQNVSKKCAITCHPAIEKRGIQGTCYTPEALQDIKEAYNKHHEDKITEKSPKEIVGQLQRRLQGRCKQEDCWLQEIKDWEKRRQLNEILFAPKRPREWEKAPTTWLSNYDLADVLRQYEVAYPEFKLLGPSAIDYDVKLPEEGNKCLWEELCRLSLEEVLQHVKTKLGVIFNLDKHDGPGTHWVSMFIDLDENTIVYYDSAANPEPREVTRLKNEVTTQAKRLHPPKKMKQIQNTIAHQSSNTECGMFCLFFIITSLTRKLDPVVNAKLKHPQGKGNKLDNATILRIFTKPGIDDDIMMAYREVYFNRT